MSLFLCCLPLYHQCIVQVHFRLVTLLDQQTVLSTVCTALSAVTSVVLCSSQNKWLWENLHLILTVVCRHVVCHCGIEGFSREVEQNCALLCHYTASSANSLPTFRNNLSVPSCRGKDLNPWLWYRQVVSKRHVGKELPLLAAYQSRRTQFANMRVNLYLCVACRHGGK